jgi:hypothetical protein
MLAQQKNNSFNAYLSLIKAYRKWGYVAGMKNTDVIIKLDPKDTNLSNKNKDAKKEETIISKNDQEIAII